MLFYLQDAVFASVLVRDAEELSVFLSRPESQLDGRDETNGLERQCVLDVALRIESSRNRLLVAAGSCPSGPALATWLRQRTDAATVFATTGRRWPAHVGDTRTGNLVSRAKFIQRCASRLTSLPHSRFSQIVNLYLQKKKKELQILIPLEKKKKSASLPCCCEQSYGCNH